MPSKKPRYSAEETAQRGEDIYQRHVKAQVEAKHHGRIVAIDVDTGDYAVDDTALAASKQLLARHPDAEIWLMRIGHRTLHRIGLHFSLEVR